MPQAKTSRPTRSKASSFTCTFCGLLCEDIQLDSGNDGQLQPDKSCPRLENELRRIKSKGSARIKGKACSLDEALNEAANILCEARQSVIAGLGTDVDGVRQAIALAEHLGAVLDHGLSDSLQRNILPLQVRGAFNATFGELRNRAELVIYVGTDASNWPRFSERFIDVKKTVTGLTGSDRQQYFLGAGLKPAKSRNNKRLHTRADALTEVLGAVKRLYEGAELTDKKIGGLATSALEELVTAIRQSQYTCIVWAASDLKLPDADLTVEAILDLIRAISPTQRCTGVPLGGDAGSMTATNVCTWQTGYPGRVSFATGKADYQPQSFSAERLLRQGEADALLWINSYPGAMSPPISDAQVIALSHPGARWRQQAAVEIPIGIPGIHHTGRAFRADSVVALPLHAPLTGELPSAADALQSLLIKSGGKV